MFRVALSLPGRAARSGPLALLLLNQLEGPPLSCPGHRARVQCSLARARAAVDFEYKLSKRREF